VIKRYERYKDSGVEWIGEIPEGWGVKKLKYVARIHTEKAENGVEKVALENIESKTGRFIETETAFDGDGVGFKKGDILYGKLRPYLAKVWVAKFDGAAVGDFFVIRTQQDFFSDYLKYRLLTVEFTDIADGSTFGSKMPRVDKDFMSDLFHAVPPLPEQTAIATFLDRKTAEIDQLIGNKEKLIALYEEEKTTIINYAVTKGLAPKVRTKPSGVDWLGDIPEHWEVKRLGHIFKVVRGASPRPAGSPLFFGGDHTPWITVAELTKDNKKFLTETTEFLTEEGRNQSRFISPETLLLSNSGATLGVPKITRIGGCINDGSVAFLNTPSEIDKSFFYYFLASLTKLLREIVQISGQPNLNTDLVKDIKVGLPPFAEQTAIVAYIETECSRLDTIIDRFKKQIELFKDYRTTLISEVVTGKIDVRDEVAA